MVVTGTLAVPTAAESPPQQPPRLVLRELTCAFRTVAAVDRVSLAIAPGEFVSLLGPSGCGKTTMLRAIAGFIEPTSGSIEMDGKIISAPRSVLPPERRRMSMIFQSYAVWPNMTVAQNVAFGLKLRRLEREVIRQRLARILDVVQLTPFAERYPSELSGGQQQRVALARAIVIDPEVLLLDEPLSNLDANLREEMRFEIRRLHDEFGYTTVYVTHDQAEAMVTSDRIAVMNAGRLEQIDSPAEIYARPRTRFVAGFLGRTNFLEATWAGQELRFDGFAVPSSRLNLPVGSGSPLLFSLRPQGMSIDLSPSSAGAQIIAFRAEIVRRAYLGELWDYIVAPEGSGLRLRLTAAPHRVFDVGAAVWVELDPEQMVPVEP